MVKRLGPPHCLTYPFIVTFNMPEESITDLMGVVAENTSVSIIGTKIKTQGATSNYPLGNGPAILKASAFAARRIG